VPQIYLWHEVPVSRRAVWPVTVRSSREIRAGALGFRRPSRVRAKQSVAGPTCHRTDTGHTIKITRTPVAHGKPVRSTAIQTRWCLYVEPKSGATSTRSRQRMRDAPGPDIDRSIR
jgi:hypothetical protein